MKKNLLLNLIFVAICLHVSNVLSAQGTPELLYYKFDSTGTSIRNLATSPPKGTSSATIYGGITQGSAAGTCGGTALLGTGTISTTDYVDTKWKDSLIGVSWTVSFWTRNLDSSTALYYIFSDPTAGNFRCFMGGASGAGNIFLRGPFNDVLLTGGSGKLPRVSTFVYDASAGYIYAYLNGKLINSVAQSSISINSTGSFILSALGGSATYGGLNPNGIMDEFRFYNRALSASEVARLLYYGKTSANINQVVCGSSSFKSPSGKYTWTTPGTYRDTILNKGYCDSFITFNLSFSNNSSSSISPSACDYYISPSKKLLWTKSGVYTDIIKNKGGCDSTITVNLTIKNSTTSLIKPNACGSYASPSGKYTWTKTGKYYDTIPNKKGCDSTITIDLKVGYANAATINVKACDRYKSPSGKNTWTNSGTYTDIIPNAAGCDSVLTIKLTIGKSTSNTINVIACDKYKSPGGKTGWVVSGTYMDTIPNKTGCDSLITVNLTLNKSTFSQISPRTCGSYTSPSGKYTYPFSISFFDTIPNSAGCDSVILVDLIVNKITSATVSNTVCKRFISPSKKHIWTISGKYYDTIPNRKGCDSLITINLTINNATVAVSQKGAKLSALADGAFYQWLNCNTSYSKITGATNQVYTATALGRYAVEVTEGTCTDTSICMNVTDLRVDTYSLYNSLSVFPNPATGQYTVSSVQPLNNASIKVINAMGETILLKNNVFGSSVFIDISGHANGIYFIEISEKENSGRLKLIKY